jgi:hypothetical protein
MELLVGTHGYPAGAAAGLVGNLLAESGVQPDRLEGSRPGTPMRTADATGRVRDFTAEEVRDRDPRAGTGPRLPGVGIAQWSAPDRRAGLFRHAVAGRVPGAAVLTDLEAQVDHLVTELGSSYRSLDALLRDPDTTVEDAADAVLFRFEVPAAVLDGGRLRSRDDPAVQPVLTHRRELARDALRAAGGG